MGDFDGDLLLDGDGEKPVILILSLESLGAFFFGEDLEKKAGRTMERTKVPGNT